VQRSRLPTRRTGRRRPARRQRGRGADGPRDQQEGGLFSSVIGQHPPRHGHARTRNATASVDSPLHETEAEHPPKLQPAVAAVGRALVVVLPRVDERSLAAPPAKRGATTTSNSSSRRKPSLRRYRTRRRRSLFRAQPSVCRRRAGHLQFVSVRSFAKRRFAHKVNHRGVSSLLPWCDKGLVALADS